MTPQDLADSVGRKPPAPLPPADPTVQTLVPPTADQMRVELETAVLMDLLGPAGGPEEELTESPRERYLVGILAPRQQRRSREDPGELAAGGADSSEEGTTEPASVAVTNLVPSSFGLSFCVRGDLSALCVTATWGCYERVRSTTSTDPKSGNPRLVWKRHPVEGQITIPLQEGSVKRTPPAEEEQPDVVIRGRIRRSGSLVVVTLFLINEQTERKGQPNRDRYWIFQPEIRVTAPDGSAAFCRRPRRLDPGRMDAETWAEFQTADMLYRHQLEFARGHGVSVHVETDPCDPTRATAVLTRVVPAYEVPQQTSPTVEERPALAGLPLDMDVLAHLPDGTFTVTLAPLPRAYTTWIDEQAACVEAGEKGLAGFRDVARAALAPCREILSRIEEGIALLDSDPKAAQAFRFANRAMALQRVRTIYALAVRRGEKVKPEDVDVPANRTWRLFQLAFILLNLPAITDLHHLHRSDPDQATADLLWFPTGGGKTEAYLGLSAYTMAIRRLQGSIEGRSGEHGVAVLMRYTLRLLTLQQYQRAAALVCACEVLRRQALEKRETRWGTEPFRIGLWVGQRTTPNTTDDSEDAIKNARGHWTGGGQGSPLQVTSCPWCGTDVDPGRDVTVETYPQGLGRTLIYCGDKYGRCPFARRNSPGEGIPILSVDEEIYRRLPAMVIATVDKFAQLPWKGPTAMLFGQVNALCTRHGFRSPDLLDASSHKKTATLPAATTAPHALLRPPDLIIQDELHLISGPLGTLVGLYETAVEALSTWHVDGRPVRPKVVASTATIRRAADQVRNLFMRRVQVFPSAGVDVEDNFFARRRTPGPDFPGRRYIGICAPGVRMKAATIRVYVAFLAAAQRLYERYGREADPWMTLAGYFNSLRDLGGTRRLVDDEVRIRLRNVQERGLPRRFIRRLEELTSRKTSADIPALLASLEEPFDPDEERRRELARKEKRQPARPDPVDVLLATNMISVGVDVQRLGLMIVLGQPKNTAEYIQATSRVGRGNPGLVCTIYNWARPRDLSHYETFEHYHATFYQHVEALSVTPFAARALDRGLTALLVSLIRLAAETLNPDEAAQQMLPNSSLVTTAVAAIEERAARLAGPEKKALVHEMLESRLQAWQTKIDSLTGGARLAYRGNRRDGLTLPLLESAGRGPWTVMTVLNSLRDVEPSVGLILVDPGTTQEDKLLLDSVTPADDSDTPAEVTP